MRRTRYIGLILATVLGLTTLAVMPVAAEDGGTSGSGDSSTATSNDASTSNETETETETEVQHLRTDAKNQLETARKNGIEHSLLQRQNACKAHETEINNRVNNYATAAERHLGVFTSILTKVQDFYTSKGLNVAAYPALLATAQAKQTDAQTAVDALKALDVDIDCTQPDPAQTVATVRTAVKNARTALQAYRTAIKDVIVALHGASSANESDTSGGNQ